MTAPPPTNTGRPTTAPTSPTTGGSSTADSSPQEAGRSPQTAEGLRLGRRRFSILVGRALRRLPASVRERLSNVAVIIEEEPSPEHLAEAGLGPEDTLFGLYSGVPLTQRSTEYGMVLPDRITIFRQPLLEWCQSEEELVDEVRKTVLHEIGHYFGMSEEELEDY